MLGGVTIIAIAGSESPTSETFARARPFVGGGRARRGGARHFFGDRETLGGVAGLTRAALCSFFRMSSWRNAVTQRPTGRRHRRPPLPRPVGWLRLGHVFFVTDPRGGGSQKNSKNAKIAKSRKNTPLHIHFSKTSESLPTPLPGPREKRPYM